VASRKRAGILTAAKVRRPGRRSGECAVGREDGPVNAPSAGKAGPVNAPLAGKADR